MKRNVGGVKLAQELVELLRAQMMFEREHVETMNKTAGKTRNAVVKQLLHGIALDSTKHADIFNALLELLHVATAMSEDERENVSADFNKHIQAEEFMIRRAEELIEKTEHPRVKFLLKYILSDEKRHHQMLKDILEQIVSKEIITEEEWWDMLYKDAVSHGAPSG